IIPSAGKGPVASQDPRWHESTRCSGAFAASGGTKVPRFSSRQPEAARGRPAYTNSEAFIASPASANATTCCTRSPGTQPCARPTIEPGTTKSAIYGGKTTFCTYPIGPIQSTGHTTDLYQASY